MENMLMRRTLLVTKALSDVQRVRILMMLQRGECCVCQIVEVLGLAASTVSRHLYLLTEAGLVVSRKEGRWSYYSLSEGSESGFASPLLRWLRKTLNEEETIVNDRRMLQKVKKKKDDGNPLRQKGNKACP